MSGPLRNMLLMDGAYMSQVSKDFFSSQLDHGKLRKFLETRYGKITRAFWFTPYDEDNNHGFHIWLQRQAKIEVVPFTRKPYRCRKCGDEHEVERGLDVGLVVKAIELAHAYDRLILCNGDGDLRDGLRYIRDVLGKQIVVVGTTDTVSMATTLNADEVVDLFNTDVGIHLLKD